MKIAFIGDVHGKIDLMYESLSEIKRSFNYDVEAIIQIGDFHAIRGKSDLKFFPVPEKHRSLGDFHYYYQKGEVPIKTYFIGGNHDNNHWHSEHPEGHELVKNLRYLGRSGVKSFDGVNIGWISGNYSEIGFNEAKRKRVKYNHFTKKDVNKLINLGERVDILLFHEWPSIRSLESGIVYESVSHFDNLKFALGRNIGSQEIYNVVKKLKPKYVFAGHAHIPLDLELIIDGSKTRFIALDKLRDFKNIIYTLDTDNMNINYYILQKGKSLEDFIDENANLREAFNSLESDKLDKARELSEQFLLESYSNEVRSLAHYCIGVSHFKEVIDGNTTNLDISVLHLKKSIEFLSHADAHLLLGHALRCQLADIFDKKSFGKLSLIEMLAKNSISAFQTAAGLNKSYMIEAEESIKNLKEITYSASEQLVINDASLTN